MSRNKKVNGTVGSWGNSISVSKCKCGESCYPKNEDGLETHWGAYNNDVEMECGNVVGIKIIGTHDDCPFEPGDYLSDGLYF